MIKRVLILLLLLLPSVVFAAPDLYSSVTTSKSIIRYTEQQLQLEKTRLAGLNVELTQIKNMQQQQLRRYILKGVNPADMAHAALSVTNAQAMVGNIQIAIADANEALSLSVNLKQEIGNRLHAATYLPPTDRIQAIKPLEAQQQALNKLITVQQERLANLQALLQLAKTRLQTLTAWYGRLQQVYRNQEQRHRIEALYAQSAKLQDVQMQAVTELNQLQQQLMLLPIDQKTRQKRAKISFAIFIAQERLSITRLQLFLNQLRARQPLIVVDPQAMSVNELHTKNSQADKLLTELSNLMVVIGDKIKLINQHRKLITDNAKQDLFSQSAATSNTDILQGIVVSYKKVQNDITLFKKQLENYQTQVNAALKRQFAVRQKLPGLDARAWMKLLHQVLTLPVLLWQSFVEVVRQVYIKLIAVSSLDATLYASASFLLIVGYFVLRKSFVSALQAVEEGSKRRFSSKVLASMITLIRRNLGTLFVIFALLGLLVLFDIDIRLWLFIAVVYLSYRVAVNIARMWLLESDTDVAGKDVRLYKGLHWVFSFAAIFSVLTVMTHSLPVSYEARILFNKIFMLLLLIFSLLLFRAWPVLPVLIKRVFSVRRAYIYRVIRLICWILPITLFSNAIIGLVGYIDLAWLMGGFQAIFLLVLCVYMIIRGLLIDFMEFVYDTVIDKVKNGWLWARAFVKPLDRVLRISLFIAMLWYLVHAYGLDRNKAFLAFINKVATTKLIVLLNNPITILFILETIIFIAILYWFAKWSREFAFRWLYLKTKDIGSRNALAVFTQYAVVIVGVIIGLRILGVDLRGLAVVAAAFAAAAGFGMRDIIANFFSGVILLVERPFRTGDTISLGTYEGEVLSTGIRSLKIRTWDHMEVIVPNTEMFTQPFTNWTHQDAIVRSVIRINIDRRDDPQRVQQLILNVLIEMPCVQKDPYPQVFMKEMSESLIELDVRFFLNLEIEKSRARVRSEVLFALWETFKRHNIRAPFPRYDVTLDKLLNS